MDEKNLEPMHGEAREESAVSDREKRRMNKVRDPFSLGKKVVRALLHARSPSAGLMERHSVSIVTIAAG
jgi:hypothetical protein